MKAYAAVVSARFRTLLQYRAAALAGLVTQLFWGWIRVMIFGAFYAATSAAQPISFPQLVTYVWLGQAMFRLLPLSPDPDVREMIRSGNVAYELARPVDVYWLWYARQVAGQTAPVLLRSLPVFVLAMAFFGMQAPASPGAGAAWVLCTLGAVILSAALAALATILLLWTLAGDGVTSLLTLSVYMLSGMVIPLPLFPPWAQRVLDWLPFRGLMDVPLRLYVGNIPAHQGPAMFAFQLAWAVILMAMGRALLARGTRRMVVQGG